MLPALLERVLVGGHRNPKIHTVTAQHLARLEFVVLDIIRNADLKREPQRLGDPLRLPARTSRRSLLSGAQNGGLLAPARKSIPWPWAVKGHVGEDTRQGCN